MKLAMWLKDYRVIKYAYVDDTVMTEPEVGLPVFIVAFNDDGGILQSEIYSLNEEGKMDTVGAGLTSSVGYGPSYGDHNNVKDFGNFTVSIPGAEDISV